MSTVARGGGGRGGRGRGHSTGVWRGSSSNTRGGLDGASADAGDRPAFGAKKRGGGAQSRGGSARNTGGSHAQELDAEGNPKKTTFVPLNKYGVLFNSTPHAKDDYHDRFLYLQAAQPSWRKQLQNQGLMNPDGQMKLSDSVKLIGRCNDMCPEYERVRRIDQKDFKRPECTPDTEHLDYGDRKPDESRMVKAFTRSSAGADVELVIDIRNPAACLKTVNYLFKRLDNEGFDYLHAWIWDRTRSVRKDLRTQVVEKRNDIQTLLTCLEASARFYLLSMHQMARSEKEDYSHQQDMEQFNQTLTTLRERYDDNRRAGITSDNEAEFVAYRLILASLYANNQLENELHGLPSDLRHNKRVLTAIDIFKAAKSAFNFGSDKGWVQAQANWKKFWDLIKSSSVSYLMACAAEVGFNRVRHVILDSIWHAYRKGPRGDISVDAWTTDKLKDVLAMDNDKDAVKLCELFGFHFERSAHGRTYLDIAKLGNSNRSIGVPHSIKPQVFSQSLVESKRHNRAFSAVIQGMTVQQAKTSGLLVDPSKARPDGEDSLFVPEKPNIFAQKSNGITTNGASDSSPFISPFNPPSQPPSAGSLPNPFGNGTITKTTPQAQSAQANAAPAFSGGWPSAGVFEADTNPIKFASTSTASANVNPFAAAAASFPPQSTTPASTPPSSFTFGTNAFPGPPGPSSNVQAAARISQANEQPASDIPKPFVFPGLPALDEKLRGEQQVEPSNTPAVSPPQPDAVAGAAERQKAEEEARQAVRKQKEERRRQEHEEQDRKVREAQQAREAEQRRQREEEQDQLRKQQERELGAKQERERLIREEQQRAQQQEQERLARMRQRETVFNALTTNIMLSEEEGLLYQYLENTVKNVVEEVTMEMQTQQRRAREAAEKEKRQRVFARAVFSRWVAQVQKKKRNAKARERRKRLKAQREQSFGSEGKAVSPRSAAGSLESTDQHNGASTKPINNGSQPPARRARRTQERHSQATNDQNARAEAAAPPRTAPTPPMRNSTAPVTMANGQPLHVRSYSEAYRNSAAPMDRTETDWFKFRAMGIDPSKHRKRSFDSATDEEPKEDVEAKRVRRSGSDASSVLQPAPESEVPAKLLTIEERLARIRAAKQSLRTSATGSPPVNGTTPSNKRSPLNGRSSLLIAQARHLITKSPTSKHPSPAVHDFGRSVPNLSTSISSFRQSSFGRSSFDRSSFGKSVDATQGNKPAYWGRASRFVPQHLYGKGPEAIRAYRDQYINSQNSTPQARSTELLALSSPILTQLSYVPQPDYTQPPYSEDGSANGVDLVDVDAEDNVAGDTEEDSFDGDDEELEEGEDEDKDVDNPSQFDTYPGDHDEDEYTEEEEQNFAQPGSSFGGIGPGATQDDAIELSD
ncbi:actin cytoskeleton and mitosis protein [Ascochyta lentis]